MSTNLANLNTNPCKMCVPLGAVTAIYGLQRAMSLLHGSQGCSTYIRRHLATHYNEPIDIASSSLTEEGTVFGGEANLVKGLDNLIKLYEPEVIAIMTTCLAETIGEDVPAIIQRYRESRPELKTTLIPVSSAGYSGTHFEGWFRAVRALLSQIKMNLAPHGGLNIITGPASPADMRSLKNFLNGCGLPYTLLPDISQNLDGGHNPVYNRLPSGGTPLAEAAAMAGARLTLELTAFCPPEISPGALLEERYHVPLLRLNAPLGLRDTDALVKTLESLGAKVPQAVREERSRYCDAMIDAHKYSALGRAALFGEPDLVLGLARLCAENGLVPVVAATGGHYPGFEAKLRAEIGPTADNALVERFSVLNFADFEAIEYQALANGTNILVGSSEARRIEERHHIPLVRCAFPIHDHVGGQRVRTWGYSGALALLDRLANTLISRQDSTYRSALRQQFYQPEPAARPRSQAERTGRHPCFSPSACATQARLHLPVAPACNISCNYCVRKYDCPNESRPGVAAQVLSPAEALARFLKFKDSTSTFSVVGIAGPGDSLADWSRTADTLSLIRQADPGVTFCLSTNGLMLPLHAARLIELGVSHVTITINAVNPDIGAKIYAHVDYFGHRYQGRTGAALLLANQLAGLKMLTEAGLVVKVNTVLLKGINDEHVVEVVQKVAGLGAYISNIMQLIPVAGSAFENMSMVSNRAHQELRKRCGQYLSQMNHCRQCRADAAGLLGQDRSIEFQPAPQPVAPAVKPGAAVKIAVVSKSGVVVDQHFGQADRFYIYESDGREVRLLETRPIRRAGGGPSLCGGSCGGGEARQPGFTATLVEAVGDCNCVLALRIGESPSQRLKEKGIAAVATYDNIDRAVREAARGLAC
ncbi:MAG: nitrogenase cofactor biosynthesis protein NifB [Candidatus Adiutrix sp.]|jgi:nitrogenase molybdenum-iron protein alpha/beta subunit/MoaA/NifB/PqqE/SkfB family radical SAM enzyme|nr:nitrogenase cofactor biosynthesis protein NifB [Candidatus Adiutrix sp.]